MFKTGIIIAAAALLANATPLVPRQNDTRAHEPITIGELGIGHGYQILAWTPTKTTINDACTDQASRTVIQSVNTEIPSNPLCGYPFEVDGESNMTLLCADGTSEDASQVTGIAINGEETHQCVEVPLNIYGTNCGGGSSLWQKYTCQ
ncbi:hypothetical protein GQ53DRAFT_753962 [Thozetella sp. PMI_491]|nr:hypothetical protein GQ53DRAFT_753962 [Thozetella sp. PMI_491]